MTRKITTTARAAVLIAVASGIIALSSPAFAADDDDALPQATLNVAHVDFASPTAIAHLKQRIRRTAYDICLPNHDNNPLMSVDQRKCYNTALKTGLAAVESKHMDALRRISTMMAATSPVTQPGH